MEQTLYSQTISQARKAEAWDKLLDRARSRHVLTINFCGYSEQGEPLFIILCGSVFIANQGTAEQVLNSVVGQ